MISFNITFESIQFAFRKFSSAFLRTFLLFSYQRYGFQILKNSGWFMYSKTVSELFGEQICHSRTPDSFAFTKMCTLDIIVRISLMNYRGKLSFICIIFHYFYSPLHGDLSIFLLLSLRFIFSRKNVSKLQFQRLKRHISTEPLPFLSKS